MNGSGGITEQLRLLTTVALQWLLCCSNIMTDTNNGLPPDVNPDNNPRPDTPLINNNNIFNTNNANRSRTNQNSLISVRDRLFHALFFKIALDYSQAVPV